MLILVLMLVSSFVTVGAFAVLLLSTSREVVSGIDVINADGGKTALIVY
ncbi:hypothetical protein MUP37_04200 [Candidatus Bathyarchaeota archaeon]|nr:hypothetical protein [Candidatus Bathyarchaeota archaeon]